MIAPPIRKPDDIEAMFEHLEAGTLDVVSTDHCGYTKESKQVDNWWDSKFGANALQTNLPVFHDEAVNRRGFSYPFLVRALSYNPARIFGLPGRDARSGNRRRHRDLRSGRNVHDHRRGQRFGRRLRSTRVAK